VNQLSKKPAVHTVKTDDGWANITEGAGRHFGSAPTKVQAEATGRASAERRGVEHLSHRADGTIGERRSYGNDPHPPKG
jgi:Uncharacterized protein conserved in bacteria (DUF2188)